MPGSLIGAFAKSSWELLSRNSDVEGHDSNDRCGQAPDQGPSFFGCFIRRELIRTTTPSIPFLLAALHAFRDYGGVQQTQNKTPNGPRLAWPSWVLTGGNHRENCWADGITAFTHSLDELPAASLIEKRRVLLESHATRKGGIRPARIAGHAPRFKGTAEGPLSAHDATGPVETSPRLPALGVYAKPGHCTFSRSSTCTARI
jgi:hypothetical protein